MSIPLPLVARIVASGLVLAAGCNLPVGNASVDHTYFVGEWKTPAPVEMVGGSYELYLQFAGSDPAGLDGTVRWRYRGVGGAGAEGCVSTVWFTGTYYAKCGEQPVAPPSFEGNATEVPKGCFDLHFTKGMAETTSCADPSRNAALAPKDPEDSRTTFGSLAYYRLDGDEMLLSYIGEAPVERCVECAPGFPDGL